MIGFRKKPPYPMPEHPEVYYTWDEHHERLDPTLPKPDIFLGPELEERAAMKAIREGYAPEPQMITDPNNFPPIVKAIIEATQPPQSRIAALAGRAIAKFGY